ncbi:cell wall-binding repeat-containing protein [Herbiconiux sp. P16]|uniref:cell wall-binding repeat-containing protein n=1 Tax=Herbiconiux wuyangfengii TaxID=3342794 RepID=UPI0035B90F4A
MNNPVLSRAASRRRSIRITGAAAVAAVGLAAGLIGGAIAPPARADDTVFGPLVTRVSGADRYDMAAQISRLTNPTGARVVYVASGASFADALSAGPAASRNAGPLLLVPPDSVPTAVTAALAILDPLRVVVVGGSLSVTEAAVAQLRTAAPHATVERISGADRYAVSRAVVADAFRTRPSAIYLATGANFPDALTAGAVAASNASPVVLVDGGAPALNGDTLGLLTSLGSRDVVLVGGTGSVSAGIEHSIPAGMVGLRVGGATRFDVSLNLNNANAANYDTVYLATSNTYPDALAGGVLAASGHHPLYIVPSDCVPFGVVAKMVNYGTKNVVLLGGTASLGPAVEALTPCSW